MGGIRAGTGGGFWRTSVGLASPCFESREILISRTRVSVPVLDDVKKPAGEVISILGYVNRMSVGHALVYREAERRIEAVAFAALECVA